MQQIGDWLKKLGMSEYAKRFAENRIDLSVLPDLTDQDLEKQARGRRNEAQGLLAPVYAAFTEGLDTADLQQAKALLDQMDREGPHQMVSRAGDL
jgi:SAM domain (Sterile alpha motif)